MKINYISLLYIQENIQKLFKNTWGFVCKKGLERLLKLLSKLLGTTLKNIVTYEVQ